MCKEESLEVITTLNLTLTKAEGGKKIKVSYLSGPNSVYMNFYLASRVTAYAAQCPQIKCLHPHQEHVNDTQNIHLYGLKGTHPDGYKFCIDLCMECLAFPVIFNADIVLTCKSGIQLSLTSY